MQTLIKILINTCLILLMCACQTTQNKSVVQSDEELRNKVQSFLQVYAFHENFELFLSFYAEDAVIEDIIRGETVQGLAQIKEFYNWDDPEFSLGQSVSYLISEQVSIVANKAFIEGYFMPFQFHGVTLGPWRFSTILEFNEQNEIVKQTDWINYTPKMIFSNSPNSNLNIQIPKYYFNSSKAPD